jgi:hypothetical protein
VEGVENGFSFFYKKGGKKKVDEMWIFGKFHSR